MLVAGRCWRCNSRLSASFITGMGIAFASLFPYCMDHDHPSDFFCLDYRSNCWIAGGSDHCRFVSRARLLTPQCSNRLSTLHRVFYRRSIAVVRLLQLEAGCHCITDVPVCSGSGNSTKCHSWTHSSIDGFCGRGYRNGGGRHCCALHIINKRIRVRYLA